MKIILSILLFCTLLLADRDGGPYIGLGYGLSQFNDDGVYKEQKMSSSTSLMLYGGAYINKYLSVELAYVNFNAGNAYKVVNDTNTEVEISFTSLNVSTLAHYAFFDDTLDFYGKFGVGEVGSSGAGTSGFTMLFGTGVGYRFNETYSMKLAYDRYLIDYNKATVEKQMNVDVLYAAFEVQF
ncbi:outer membrane beta-barrel protein [Sulfurimonas sp.]|uniref:outer membrane beta-barrel protein n=1 Tax=Sulfurimonas sp. TaxID=2022749 RepID=UPI0035672BF0